MELSDWKGVSDEGALPEELLPCSYLQYRWRVLHQFNGGGSVLMKMPFWLRLGDSLESHDQVTVFCTWIPDGFGENLFSYNPQEITTTGPETTPTFASGQMVWEYFDPGSGGGISTGMPIIDIFLVSPIYNLSLAQGAELEVLKHFPLENPEHWGWYLEFRTVKGEGGTNMQSFADPALGHKVTLYNKSGTLLCRVTMGASGIVHGVESGMSVAIASGRAAIAPGVVWVGYKRFTLEEDAIASVASDAKYIVARAEGGELVIEAVAAVPAEPHTLVATLSGGKADTTMTGSMVTDRVADFGAIKLERGRLVAPVKKSGSDAIVEYVSSDYGMSWAAQT